MLAGADPGRIMSALDRCRNHVGAHIYLCIRGAGGTGGTEVPVVIQTRSDSLGDAMLFFVGEATDALVGLLRHRVVLDLAVAHGASGALLGAAHAGQDTLAEDFNPPVVCAMAHSSGGKGADSDEDLRGRFESFGFCELRTAGGGKVGALAPSGGASAQPAH